MKGIEETSIDRPRRLAQLHEIKMGERRVEEFPRIGKGTSSNSSYSKTEMPPELKAIQGIKVKDDDDKWYVRPVAGDRGEAVRAARAAARDA